MLLFITALLASAITTIWIIRAARHHGHLSSDHDLSGPQKFHTKPVPRIGGVGILVGLLSTLPVLHIIEKPDYRFLALLLVCAAPAFIAGLTEDLTKNVSPRRRLLFTMISAGLAIWLLGGTIQHTGFSGLDWLLGMPLIAVVFTIVAVAGATNAVNIIDGFNGLASMCVAMMLLAIAYVAFQVGDSDVMYAALCVTGAVLGFFIWNFPAGLIFLGDGGAYFLGFLVAELAILLFERNPQVSPIFSLLICIYPVFETIFSIYRKKFIRKMSPTVPDGVHLHMLVYKRLMRWTVGARDARAMSRRNSFTSPYLWTLCLLSIIPSVLFWDSTLMLSVFVTLFAVLYVAIYWSIVRFRTPQWMVVRRKS